MKPKLAFLEIAFKVAFIGLFFWVIIVALIKGNYWSLLDVLLGAAAWEYILFFLHRFGVIDVAKYWKGEEDEENDCF